MYARIKCIILVIITCIIFMEANCAGKKEMKIKYKN